VLKLTAACHDGDHVSVQVHEDSDPKTLVLMALSGWYHLVRMACKYGGKLRLTTFTDAYQTDVRWCREVVLMI